MGTLALTLPTIGQPNSSEDVKIPNALSAIQTEYNTNIPNVLASIKSVSNPIGYIPGGTTAGEYYLLPSNIIVASSSSLASSGLADGFTYLASTDYAIAGYTTKLNLRAIMLGNATSAGVGSITYGLKQITAGAGGSPSTLTVTLGAFAISTSIVAAGSGPQSLTVQAAFPSNGLYLPVVSWAGTAAANSGTVVGMQISVSYL